MRPNGEGTRGIGDDNVSLTTTPTLQTTIARTRHHKPIGGEAVGYGNLDRVTGNLPAAFLRYRSPQFSRPDDTQRPGGPGRRMARQRITRQDEPSSRTRRPAAE